MKRIATSNPTHRVSSSPRKILWTLAMAALLSLVACASTPTATPPPVEVVPTAESVQPTLAPTQPPQATATASLPPEPTPAPSPTPLPELAVQTGGFDAWCAPLSMEGAAPTGPDAPQGARRLQTLAGREQVQVPAAYCTLILRFNQPIPPGTLLTLIDGSHPFIHQELTPAGETGDTGWLVVRHPYVIDPPFWEVTYQVVASAPDGREVWSQPLTFARALPEECIFGGLPDLHTGACPVTDPWEVEPHPGVKYPYDHDRLLTPPAP